MKPAIVATPPHAAPKKIETLCPFVWSGTCLQAILQRPFEPKGLMLWDVPEGTQLMIFVGTNLELIASYGPLPARWFAAWESFQQVAAKLDEGFEPPGWGTFSKVQPGVMIRLSFQKPDGSLQAYMDFEKIEALMWGYTQ